MAPKPFTPSIDWSTAAVHSARWLAEAWVISAVSLVGVLILLRYVTVWGRQYWRITGGYFTGAHALRVWLMLGLLLT